MANYFGFNSSQAKRLRELLASQETGSISTAELADGAVTNAKVASGIAASKIANPSGTAYAADGAISPAARVAFLTKAGVGAYTLAAPAEGDELLLINKTANAHVVTSTDLIEDGVTGGAKDTMTFGAFAGASIHLFGSGGKWYVVAKNVVTIAGA